MIRSIHIDSTIEKEYLSANTSYSIQSSLLSSLSVDDMNNIAKELYSEYVILNYIQKFRMKLIWLLYEDLKEIEIYFLENMFLIFTSEWQRLLVLEETLSFFEREITRRSFNKKNNNGFKPIDISLIPITSVVWLYTKLPTNLQKNIKCPIHNDKTPSFKIYNDTNSWYCFGCHKWGNAVNLIAEMENVSTKEAYKILINNFS